MGLTDGLGYEEVGQAGSQVASLFLTGSVTTDSQVSGLNVYANGSLVGNTINDSTGALHSVIRGTGASLAYGAKVFFGSCATTSAGFGSAIFPEQFNSTQYFFTAQTGSTSALTQAEAISGVVIISGPAGRNVSGVTFKGIVSTPYTWLAVGI